DSVASDHVVRHYVHGLRLRDGVARGQGGGARRLRAATSLEAHSQEDASNDSCRARDHSTEPRSAGQSACVEHHAAGFFIYAFAAEPGTEKALIFAPWLGLQRCAAAVKLFTLPLCGRGGTGRRTSLRGWR